MNKERTLIFLDDEPNILKALKRVFFKDDYTIKTFTSGFEALAFLKDTETQLVIADQRMPGMTGTEFFNIARDVSPECIRIILTGYADLNAAVDAINKGQVFQFVFKPWNDTELRALVLRGLDYYDLRAENMALMEELKAKNAELEEWGHRLNLRVKERTEMVIEKYTDMEQRNKLFADSLINIGHLIVNLVGQIEPEVSRRAQRMASLAVTMAEEMGLKKEQKNDLEIACLLHETSLFALPGNPVESDGRKADEPRWNLVHGDVIFAQNALGSIDVLEKAGLVIRHMKEHWDGSGAPDGLTEEDIPVESRIMAACSEYFDMLSKGTDRGDPSLRKLFESEAGKKFDPTVSRLLLQITKGEEEDSRKRHTLKPGEIEPGMVLASGIETKKRVSLLPVGQVLSEIHVSALKEIHRIDPIVGGIEVFVDE